MKRGTAFALALFLLAWATAARAEEGEARAMKPCLPVALNVLPGLGIGSFVQGDRRGGYVGLGGEVLGFGLASTGMIMGYGNILGVMFSGMTGESNGASGAGAETGMYLAIGGAAIWAATKIYEIVRPFAYARRTGP